MFNSFLFSPPPHDKFDYSLNVPGKFHQLQTEHFKGFFVECHAFSNFEFKY